MPTIEEKKDEELIALYIQGDARALEMLIQRYLTPIYRYALQFSGNADETEDITQETFLKFWKNIAKYKQGEKFSSWLFRIAHNAAIDHIRKRRFMPFSFFDRDEGNSIADTLEDTEPLSDELFARVESARALERYLQKLSPQHRAVLHLHYYEELPFIDIGRILGVPLDTAKSQHRRALFALRKLIPNEDAPNW